MRIDCDDCRMQDTSTCDDCIVTFLLDRPNGAIVFDAEQERALRVLQDAGLTPRSRFTRRATG
ncbi:MAG: hypothetical protein ACRDYX_15030 [Egibacteraceae bacterium]